MKKSLAILLSAALLIGMICSAGVFTVSAEENQEDVYSVMGNSENVFYNAYDEYDETTEMTYDPHIGLYKLMLYDVQPEQDIEIYIVKNHDIVEDLRQGFDVYSTYFIFDVVSPCNILITYDVENNIVDVLGEGVIQFNVRDVYMSANGSNTFYEESNNYKTNRAIKMTEVESKVWEVTVDNVLTSSDPYCTVAFGVNRYWYEYQSGDKTYGYYQCRFGFGNVNREIVGSGVETSAAVNKSIGIAFKVEENFSTVKFRLDLRNFDYRTKKGAKFTITVTPPEKETDFSLLFVDENDEPYAPDSEIPMEYNPKTGLYELSVTNDFPSTDCRFYVLKNHGEDGKYGDPETGESYYYDVNTGGDIDITFDPLTHKINIIGYGVLNRANFHVENVVAAGNGSGSFLGGANWTETYSNNRMTETSPGVWEITYNDITANDNYKVKFALNTDPYSTNPWQFNLGSINGASYNSDEEQAVARNGGDICFKVAESHSKVSFKLDLRDFSFRNRNTQRAKLTITVTPPEHTEYPTILGDVNGDRYIDILDAAMIQKYAASKVKLNKLQKHAADYNKDGKIDILDSIAIQRRSSK